MTKWASKDGCTISADGLAVTTSGINYPAMSDIPKTGGLWYFELKWNNEFAHDFIGIAAANATSYHSSTTVLLYRADGQIYSGYTASRGSVANFSTSDIIGVAVDIDNNMISFYKNGLLINSWTTTDIKSWNGVYAFAESGWSSGGTSVTANFDGPFIYPPNQSSISKPNNLTANAGDSQVTLSWNAVEEATGYNVKRSTTAGGPYTTIATNVPGTSYIDNTVTNGTTYYYVVTAVDSNGNESANSNEASATPVATQVPTGQALLRVTMIDSSEREYRLPIAAIDGFINWYTRTIGTGISCYSLNDIIDNSKEYLSFEKIISFKVIPLKD
jgi:hypothetical protein